MVVVVVAVVAVEAVVVAAVIVVVDVVISTVLVVVTVVAATGVSSVLTWLVGLVVVKPPFVGLSSVLVAVAASLSFMSIEFPCLDIRYKSGFSGGKYFHMDNKKNINPKPVAYRRYDDVSLLLVVVVVPVLG
jgi:hypothetical protein